MHSYVLPVYNDWFHPYSWLIMIGFFCALGVTFLKAKLKNIPLIALEKYIMVLLPCSVISASFFGKINAEHPIPFYELFFFWEAGLSIHGAIIGGLIGGLFYFPSQSSRYKISMWVWLDIIAPNILIGQCIGRWGNFFNHEILGNPVSLDQLTRWLPHWIANSCFRFDVHSTTGYTPETDALGNIIYRQPLFLYESILDAFLWISLTFLIPNIGKWTTKRSITHSSQFADLKSKDKWNLLYYELEVDYKLANEYNIEYKSIKKTNKKMNYSEKQKYWWKNKKEYIKFLYNKDVSKLTKLHNPYKINIIRSGTTGSLYFMLYNILRLGLETQRQSEELFIKFLPWVSYSLIFIFACLGLTAFIFAQFISPNKWRQEGWYYEKQY